MTPDAPHPLDFFGHLQWLDGRPLLHTIEPYRRDIFTQVLYTFDERSTAMARPRYDRALCGRAKKNWKSADLALAALYRFLVWPSAAGNDCFILANDEDQAGDDLALVKKLIACNPLLAREVTVNAKAIVRNDGRGTLQILPAKDIAGSHGKTYLFIGFDEIHAYRNHDLFEALSPDPTRPDALTWITSYAGIRHAPGVPLYDFMQAGKAGTDPRMYFSWYGGDFTTDPAFADLPAEQRANPSIGSWADRDYLEQQRARLPTHKYRRLHLNLPGAPEGAAFSMQHVMAAIVPGRRYLPYQPGVSYEAFVDMSGGSNDDAIFSVAHVDKGSGRKVLDCVISQAGKPPFNPRVAIKKFASAARDYHCHRVTGDDYAGETFKADFQAESLIYRPCEVPKSELYEELEPQLNAGEVELLDIPELQEQLLTLVWRGTKIDHEPSGHDDWANGAAGALWLVAEKHKGLEVWRRLGAAGKPRQPTAEEAAAEARRLLVLQQREVQLTAEQKWTTGGYLRPERLRIGDEPLTLLRFVKPCTFNDKGRLFYFPAGEWPVPTRLAGNWWLKTHATTVLPDTEPAQPQPPPAEPPKPSVPRLGFIVI
jgi:hypothetical protein